jgi:hypothetical protein
VPVWLRRIRFRRATSIAAVASWPGVIEPSGRVPPQVREGERGVSDLGGAAVGGDRAGVADLTAALGVERRAVEEQLDAVVVGGRRDHGEHAGLRRGLVISGERGGAELLHDLAVGIEVGVVAGRAAGRLGPLALLGHRRLEPGHVDGDVPLTGDLLRQLEREAVGVVEGERRRTGQLCGAAGELRFEDREPVAQGLAEALLLLLQHADDEVALASDVGIGVAHDVDGDLGQRRHDELLGAEQVGVADRPADDAAQDEAPRLVAREHAVADQHRRRAGVLGQHAYGEAVAIVVVARAVRATGERAGLVDQRHQQIGLPDALDTLEEAEDPLEAGARVDVLLRQRRTTAVGPLVVLHEDQVPELHEPPALGVGERATFGAVLRPAVEVQLAARPARPGLPHLPEVVLVAQALDARHRDAHDVVPDLLGLVVTLVDGDPDPLGVEPEGLGRVLPRPRDRLLLEVVPEAPVAEHLEEHEVAGGAPDVVEVVVLATGAHALLRVGDPRERRRRVTDEVRLERHHPGDGEQHRRVVRDQARRRHHDVVASDEEVEERLAKLVGGARWTHRRTPAPMRATEHQDHRCERVSARTTDASE